MDVEMEDVEKSAPVVEQDPSERVLADSSVAGTVSVSLHPLVIMNISEHWTRSKAQEKKPVQVYGALIGKQTGRDIEICNSFELAYNLIDGDVVIDREYYHQKEEQFKQVFSEMDFLGWYSTGDKPTSAEIKIHRQITDINEFPLFLQLSPGRRNSHELPLGLYESVIDMEAGQARILFVKLAYSLATEEAERIGLDHVARIVSGSDSTVSHAADLLVAQYSAIKMLSSRARIILSYMKAVQKGELPPNQEILRQIRGICHRLPVLPAERFESEFSTQGNDVAVMVLLGTIMKAANNLNGFVNKFGLVHQRKGMGRRMRGLLL